MSAYIDRQSARLAEGVGYSFAIAETSTDEAVGQIGLWVSAVPETGSASIGYWIGQGFTREVFLPQWHHMGGEARDMFRYGFVPGHGDGTCR